MLNCYLDNLKALLAVDGVDEDVAVDVDTVLRGEYAVLVLTSKITQIRTQLQKV